MDIGNSLTVRVERRGHRYVWELHREGLAQPVKFSVAIYVSKESARTSGNEAGSSSPIGSQTGKTDKTHSSPIATNR